MRWWIVAGVVAACGGDGASEGCDPNIELGEADVGCTCAGDVFELSDQGEICGCTPDGIVCDPEDSGSTTSECRSVVDCTSSATSTSSD